ncbi:hypothetical protein Barb4_04123 [Bacteroidales bacterium Barb4]|nr:hypothetical protein Barb4_04123 [Bacteroidales bacterium Barb4]
MLSVSWSGWFKSPQLLYVDFNSLILSSRATMLATNTSSSNSGISPKHSFCLSDSSLLYEEKSLTLKAKPYGMKPALIVSELFCLSIVSKKWEA